MKENTQGTKGWMAIADSISIKHYIQPAFLMCVAVLAVGGIGMSVAIKSFGVYLKKEPLPLKKSLALLDEGSLAPYKVASKEKIENEEIVKSLGTEDYIQWHLEDTNAAPDSPVRYCFLFVTYYGLPDLVFHIPEECYAGSGYQRLASDSVTIEIDRANTLEKIPAKHLVFTGANSNYWSGDMKFSALYLFRVNDEYTSNREDVRVILNKNIFGRHSYFSKIEWCFFNSERSPKAYLTKEQAEAASQKLLSVILPILEGEHWPVWKDGQGDER